MSDAIVIDGLTKTFGPKLAVNNVSLRIPTGTVCGFIGPNGAGKTTTIRMIMSIIFPDRGRIRVLGKDSAVESKDRIGYLPEERGIYKKMRVNAFLMFMGRLKGLDDRTIKQRTAMWLERVGLADVGRKRCEELSKGMQQKIQFVAAVIHEPELLILDEVFSGLDPVNRRLMRDLIHEQHAGGRTIIFSTHNMFEAEQLCDNVLMIHQGHKVLDAPVREILARFDPHAVIVEPMQAERIDSLRGLPGVREIIRPLGPGAAGRSYEVRLYEDADVSGAITRIAEMLPVRKIELKRATLEDIFIEMVTKQENVSAEQVRAEIQQAAAEKESQEAVSA